MKLYINNFTDPYFNLASEEYLLDNEPDDVFMLWQNDRSVIIGRNQNAYAEINRPFVEKHGIAVVRRLTGGGAVFHDRGNLNFTFIVSRGDCPEPDFTRFCIPIVEALRALGVPAEISGRNDLAAEGRKFSGNAQCFYKNRTMHHGTLLFSADMSFLSGALNVDPEKMKSKGIKSVRSRVCNLSEYLPELTVEDLKAYLESRIPAERTEFTEDQIKGIKKLRDEKYASWEWDYGVSKTYGNTVKKRFPFGSVEIAYTSENGILSEVKISGDYFGKKDTGELERSLCGCRLEGNELLKRLENAGEYISGADGGMIKDMFLL